jgi:hypothetical protein
MIRLDKAALDYLVSVAQDAGFQVTNIDSYETEEEAPVINLRLRQTKAHVALKEEDWKQQATVLADAAKASMRTQVNAMETLEADSEI